MPSDAALSLSGLNAFYGDSHILHDVSLEVAPGRILALLGRNGAGKTTCMNALAGLLPTRTGRIVLNGRDISAFSPEAICRAGLALVPQGRRIFRSLSVEENLAVARCARPPDERVAWTDDDIFGLFPRLKERRRHPAGLMSGGEQQMLAIGRALVTAPRVLLMDEPTEGLAPQIVAEVGAIVGRLRAAGLSVILVEQHMAFALKLADEVVVISTGRVVDKASASAFQADPARLEEHLGVH
ncbi:ABC transporter ATP-binding protein [Xanthobacter sp. YC-JY1]|uniref:ABC transporter ATP-binding protein n=1 Tax=Xanthobacter sp. YC-JY1 TaxID=2419844 RepID=UPI001F16246D|nr:ABC transporter ATP-binding protein [Xanthobacter sp. YC-JY1]UJX44177.1 ABC transporter ATP-binding protein [Xanthobacter sp. YC-JY1]